jgi:non-specific serine/threonine protein kinase
MDDFASFLPVIAKLDLPIFLMNNRNTFKQRLYPSLDPVQMEVALAHEGEDYSLQAGLSFQGDTFSTIKGSLEILSDNPAWVLAGRYLAPVDNPEVLSLLHFFPVTIPGKEVEEFRQNYFPVIVKRVPIRGDVISWTDVEAEPVPRLYLRDQEGVLSAELRFGYGDYEVTADPKAGPETVLDVPGSWGMVRIHRRLETEARHYQQLGQKQFGLKRAPYGSTTGTFELRARTHPLDFLLHSIPSLTKAGYEVYGQDDLKTARINRNKPLISLNISSGIDWFDVQAVVRYGDQEVPLRDLRRALGKRERFIKLADGSIGQIPEEWIEKYKKLFDLAEDTGDSLRVRDYQLPLVDTLLEEADQRQIAAEFQERRERLRRFERVHPQPIPQGFAGELRPYQKAGFDWLHFLHEYGFGGCLADDMGLGKTIQALAFLQSLKELGKNQGPALLVVPKSLIGNWLREAERFTPDLRFLAYIGNNRPKDTSIFTEYDVILTTYQTMLRDIELLRKYPFYYVILDESQNIKNPLSQSSKAVRLINAKHHLVMTGTPVENNTFELWSQFAFLNPGLLGSLDYFKREFASPIENRTNSSEVTIQLLRKLIFPFILRRTKEQVAPELPERTERLLYTDLEPAQRRLYNQTRDYYRGVLLGMIDKEGINDVRMKILEGLLRLRQICIHPALIQQNFHGDSTKFELLLETLDTLQSEGHKALIFSQFVETLHLLQAELDARGIRYTYLDGQTVDRQAQIDTFQSDLTIPFFLISLKAGGVGLNLTAADYVIHIDPWWNPAVEMQAADRAHRIGQDKPVFIYKIIVRNSVEEKILQLQERKKELVDQLISTDASIFKSMTKEDVQALFS